MHICCSGHLTESFVMEFCQVFEENIRNYFREIICVLELN